MNDPIDPSLLRRLEEDHKDLRLNLARLPRRNAPPDLLRGLKRQYIATPWQDRVRSWFAWPVIWKPASAMAMAALVAGLWISHWKNSEEEFIDLQPLVTAHARYQAETLVPDGDMAGTNFGTQLAKYYGEEN